MKEEGKIREEGDESEGDSGEWLILKHLIDPCIFEYIHLFIASYQTSFLYNNVFP